MIEKYNIDKMVMEDVQYQQNVVNNVQTFKTLAEILGVLIEYAVEKNIPYDVVLAGTWKKFLGIKGAKRAEQKKNAQLYIVDNYNVKPTQDECDAICIGLWATHSKSSAF